MTTEPDGDAPVRRRSVGRRAAASGGSAVVPDADEALSPVSVAADEESPTEGPREGLALCLSGGGSRAMLFHAGSLIRLNEARLLETLACVSSVSGGSIAAGTLAVAWPDLDFRDGIAARLDELVVRPLRRLAGVNVDVATWLIGAILPNETPATRFADVLDERLYHGATLGGLPERPRFVINATNLATGVLWKFSRDRMGDYRAGYVDHPHDVRIAMAVAASSAFPPAYAPLRLAFEPGEMQPPRGSAALDDDAFRLDVPLGDGGIYDNLGMETAWKAFRTVFVSDGGGDTKADPDPPLDPVRQTIRVMHIIDRQVRSLRKRMLIAGYRGGIRTGAYWGIRTDIADFGLSDVLPCPHDATLVLAEEPTRLAKMAPERQKQLINWGYAVTDAALRAHYLPEGTARGNFPFPSVGVGAVPEAPPESAGDPVGGPP